MFNTKQSESLKQMADKFLFAFFAFNMILTLFSLGVWGLACLTMIFIHPFEYISWMMFVQYSIFLYYMHKEEKEKNV